MSWTPPLGWPIPCRCTLTPQDPTTKGDTMTRNPDPFPWDTDEAANGARYPGDTGDDPTPEPDPEPAAAELEPYAGLQLDPETMLDAFAAYPARSQVVAQASAAMTHAVRTRADERRDARRKRVGDAGVQHTADLRREIVGAANDCDVLTDLGGAFLAAAKEAKGITGDLLDELPARNGKPRASAKVGDGEGFDLTVTRTTPTTLSVDTGEVVDVLVASLAIEQQHAQGLRDGMAALLELLSSSPGWKSTALDALVRRLQNAGEDDLAARLSRAYGKSERGEAAVKLARVKAADA